MTSRDAASELKALLPAPSSGGENELAERSRALTAAYLEAVERAPATDAPARSEGQELPTETREVIEAIADQVTVSKSAKDRKKAARAAGYATAILVLVCLVVLGVVAPGGLEIGAKFWDVYEVLRQSFAIGRDRYLSQSDENAAVEEAEGEAQD